MTILVTGAAGFIGANFVYHLHQAHPRARVVCLDSLTYAGNLATLLPLIRSAPGAVAFYRADICDRDAVNGVFAAEAPDSVVNLAAESHVDRSIRRPAVFARTNLLGTQVLLNACLAHGVSRFHQVSTDEVYGQLPLNRPELAFGEEAPLCPSSPYSATKAGADLLALAYHRTYGLGVTVSRCSNNYGPFQFPEKLIPLMIVNGLRDQPLSVYGKGENVRDWLHVEDHCRALDLIVQGGRPGEIYNIGAGTQERNIDVVRAICRLLGKPEGLITFVEDRPGHDLRYAVHTAKLRGELGWRPQTPFAAGLERTVQWYLAHRAWWEPILAGAHREHNEKLCEELA